MSERELEAACEEYAREVRELRSRVAELERERDEAWNATGVAGAVRGLTTLADVIATNRKHATGLQEALQKINAIRNDIVGMQSVGFSRHIYPLVAALNEAGIEGAGYTEARAALVKEMADEKAERERVTGLEAALSTLLDAAERQAAGFALPTEEWFAVRDYARARLPEKRAAQSTGEEASHG